MFQLLQSTMFGGEIRMFSRPRGMVVVATLAGLGIAADAQPTQPVNLTLTPLYQPVGVNQIVEIDLVANSDTAIAQSIGAMEVIISWDETKLELLGYTLAHSQYTTWFAPFTGFLAFNPLNTLPLNDGEAKYYTGSSPGLPAFAPPAADPGLIVTTFRFRSLAFILPGTQVCIEPQIGAEATLVYAASPPNTNVTGEVDDCVTVAIGCFHTCTGDVNGDNADNLSDLSLLLASFGASFGDAAYNVCADFNFSGTVDLSDLSVLLSNFGTVCP